MPEGPEIRRAADKLEKAVGGKPLTHVWFAFLQLQPYQSDLIGCRVIRFETRGKALLTHFSNGMTLYSHNQLYGVWRVVKPGEEPVGTRSPRVRLETADKAVVLLSASDISLWVTEEIETHPFLARIGPDVLDMTLTPDMVRERLMSPAFCRRQLAGTLLDQAFIAGLGNYLRAEILWQAQLAPQHKPQDLSEEQREALADAVLSIARLSYATRGKAKASKHHDALFRFRVFHRAGKPCERCGGIIEKTTLSSRPFYWCPACQH